MKDRIGPLLLAAGVAVLVLTGWRVFFFLTDDAFIAFRYASNSMLGYGLVWNPPPFQPVEGYTSWLWVVLLRWVWWLTGAQPPLAANYLALACGCATLVVGALLVREVALPDRLARVRLALLALVLLGTATNRTFLAWLSSGLETALFNLCVTFWIYQALRRSRPLERRRIFWLSMGAAASALTRPDGLLFAAATIVLVGIDLLEAPGSMRTRVRRAVWSFPLLLPVVHLFWRRAKYGEWLPNTYYAKHLAPWPESGVRYLAAFVLEYALWFWVALVLAWSVVWALKSRRIDPKALVVMGAVLGQVGYYTLQIGGDHFEYRVYSHLILLILVSTVWLLARLDLRPAVALLALGSFVMVSWPVPWVHWWETRDLRTRKETLFMVRPIAERFPTPLRSYVGAFDTLQAWLIRHAVGVRHQEHKIYAEFRQRTLPSREQGERIRWQDHPVHATGQVGVVGWVLPHVAIIDLEGLNDHVVARTASRSAERRMAHDREPPAGYVECFRPNVRARWEPAGGRKLARTRDVRSLGGADGVSAARPAIVPRVAERSTALDDDSIAACEQHYRKLLED